VHSADKVGRDAGELGGSEKSESLLPNSIDDIIALKPDCVMYMPQWTHYDEVCRLLQSGINIVTTRTEFLNPASMNPQVRERVEAACQRGNTSIHSTGCSPGFATEALPLLLTCLQRRLDRLNIYEFADNSSRNSPQMLFESWASARLRKTHSAAAGSSSERIRSFAGARREHRGNASRQRRSQGRTRYSPERHADCRRMVRAGYRGSHANYCVRHARRKRC